MPIVNNTVNALAATILPDAPVDPVTGLKVPTIAVATGGGVSVIKHDGTVTNSALTTATGNVSFSPKATLEYGLAAASTQRTKRYPGYLKTGFYEDASYYGLSVPAVAVGAGTGLKLAQAGTDIAFAHSSVISKLREAISVPAKGVVSYVSPTYNTGHLVGDIRRAYLSDSVTGSLTGPELVTNGGFDTDTTGWAAETNASISLSSGRLQITKGSSGANYGIARQNIAVSAGRTYAVTCTFIDGTSPAYLGVGSTSGGVDLYNAVSQAAGTRTFYLTATTNTLSIRPGVATAISDRYAFVDNISVREVIPDRSYKAAGANIEGTVTAAAVANNAQLVAYSGFSAANYIREEWSADLDFGTGEWSVGAWLNTTQPAVGGNLLTNSQWVGAAIGSPGTVPTGYTIIFNTGSLTGITYGPDGSAEFELTCSDQRWVLVQSGVSQLPYTSYTHSIKIINNPNSLTIGSFLDHTNAPSGSVTSYNANGTPVTSAYVPIAGDRIGLTLSVGANAGTAAYRFGLGTGSNATGTATITQPQLELSSVATEYKPTTSTAILPVGALAHHSFSSGPAINLQMTHEGKLQAVAFDGTTTRTVTTSAAYNTGTWTKVRATYTTDGTLGLTVNGQSVATTTGAPLLTLNNSNAVLTIGNSYALDAPFPGSISLVKLSATVPTAEQAMWMYEQEKQLFREGAQCVLPSSGNVIDLAYDDETDTWSALQATHESTWSGLVRTSTQTPSAGSFAKCVAGSGNKLLARTTTNPGVDIQMPARNLKAELSKKSEAAMRLSSNLVTFDYVGGFTATISANSTSITSVSGLSYPTSYIGAVVTGSGIPASTTITNVSGTTIYLSNAATASASGVQISFTDFVLPVGYEAKTVMSAGVLKQEGSTKDWTRLFDGFKETIRFGTAPGYTTWVSIQAERTQS